MALQTNDGLGALTQLRAFLAQEGFPPNTKLPPEREFRNILGVSRGDLRKALAVLEGEGEVWRHVGKGTFIGTKPAEDMFSFSTISEQTSPAEVIRTRIIIEPVIAREAAIQATADNIREMRGCLKGSREARSWRQYESWDNKLHSAIAAATRNTLLVSMCGTMNTVRRAVVWGQLRPNKVKPPANHHSFAEHEAIVDAIEQRDMQQAADRMRCHLVSVQQAILEIQKNAE
ncbi:MAG: FadR family transcriptional regulator [Rhodospirillales bacterium]|jgi:DNA-binding FadR family transcriptional regulator|nr:FadR family transcriptional regulator [Rhodospirillales bacterium]